MSQINDTRSVGEQIVARAIAEREQAEPVNPHRDTIRGLLSLAGFLEIHPELPAVKWMTVRLTVPYDNPRPTMELIAAILDSHGLVVEKADSRTVQLVSNFGGEVEVSAEAYIDQLGPPPAVPAYESILVKCDRCFGHGHIDSDPLADFREACDQCEGRGYLAPVPVGVLS